MKKIILLVIPLSICIAISSCSRKAEEKKIVLARVSSRVITLDEFQAKINKLPPYYQNIVKNDRKRYLEDMILEQLMYEEAVRKGIDREKEVKELVNEAKKKILIAKFVKEEVDSKAVIQEKDLMQYYESHKDDFKTPELWRASHILVASENQARDVQAELAKGANFEDLAKKYSMDATNTRGGDVGYFRAGQVIPEFEKACLDLEPGKTSEIVHTQFGYHIIKLTDKKEPSVLTFQQARPIVESEMKKRMRQELFGRTVLQLKNKYNVEIDEEQFNKAEDAKKETQ